MHIVFIVYLDEAPALAQKRASRVARSRHRQLLEVGFGGGRRGDVRTREGGCAAAYDDFLVGVWCARSSAFFLLVLACVCACGCAVLRASVKFQVKTNNSDLQLRGCALCGVLVTSS